MSTEFNPKFFGLRKVIRKWAVLKFSVSYKLWKWTKILGQLGAAENSIKSGGPSSHRILKTCFSVQKLRIESQNTKYDRSPKLAVWK